MPAVEPALLPSAVRASWELQKWDLLDDALNRCESSQTRSEGVKEPTGMRLSEGANDAPAMSDVLRNMLMSATKPNPSSGAESNTPPLRLHTNDNFEVAMGYLMSCLHGGVKEGFKRAVRDFRVQVSEVTCRESEFL